MENKSAEEIRLKNMRYDMIMEDEFIQRHAYHNNSNTSQVNSKKDKTTQDDVYIDSLHIITTTITITMTIIMTIIIQ